MTVLMRQMRRNTKFTLTYTPILSRLIQSRILVKICRTIIYGRRLLAVKQTIPTTTLMTQTAIRRPIPQRIPIPTLAASQIMDSPPLQTITIVTQIAPQTIEALPQQKILMITQVAPLTMDLAPQHTIPTVIQF